MNSRQVLPVSLNMVKNGYMETLNNQNVKGVLVAVGVLLSIFLALKSWEVWSGLSQTDFNRPSITINGDGKVFAKPDIAQVSLGVQVEKPTIEEAQKEATEISNNTLKMLKESGVDEKDIKTTNYSITPVYDYRMGGNRVRGYQVSQSMQVKIRNLSKSGVILSSAGELGANQVGGLSFTTDDPEKLREEARNKAIEDARSKAEALSKKLGVKLGKIISFYESGGGIPPIPYFAESKAMGIGGGMATPPEIPVGENEIAVSVSVTYQLK